MDIVAKDKITNKLNWIVKTTRFKHKVTGEIVTQVDITEINDYEELED